ncbi:hypothetical protein [Streptomyces sp. V1I6]|uniref:hypothetical protein n=1 Tax=Streptomyces sp. V1I6 TaxID=3042273 RepID=UPI0027840072|nr:hypothetical protein [Streptomyces sp. V1I6]MDQ0847392.1 hypothetical protein [Streptomyces sp. V1I6]
MRITIEIDDAAEQPTSQDCPPPVPRAEPVAGVDMGPAPNSGAPTGQPPTSPGQPLPSTDQPYTTDTSSTTTDQAAGTAPGM